MNKMVVISFDDKTTEIYYIKDIPDQEIELIKTNYIIRNIDISRIKISISGRIFFFTNDNCYLKELVLFGRKKYDFTPKGITCRIVDSIIPIQNNKTDKPRTSENFLSAIKTRLMNEWAFKMNKNTFCRFQLKIDETKNILYQFIDIKSKTRSNVRNQCLVIYDLGIEDTDFAYRFNFTDRDLVAKIKTYISTQFNLRNYSNDFIASINTIKKFKSSEIDLIIFMESGLRVFIEIEKGFKKKRDETSTEYRLLCEERPLFRFEVRFVKLPEELNQNEPLLGHNKVKSYDFAKFKDNNFIIKPNTEKYIGKNELIIIHENFQAMLEVKDAVKDNKPTELGNKEAITELNFNSEEEVADVWCVHRQQEINPNKIQPYITKNEDPIILLKNQQNFFVSKDPFFKQLFYGPDIYVAYLTTKLCKLEILRPIDRLYTVIRFYHDHKSQLTINQKSVILDELKNFVTIKNCDELLIMLIQLLCQTNLELFFNESLYEFMQSIEQKNLSQTNEFNFKSKPVLFKIKKENISRNDNLVDFILEILLNFTNNLIEIVPSFNFDYMQEKIKHLLQDETSANYFIYAIIIYLNRLMRYIKKHDMVTSINYYKKTSCTVFSIF